MELDLQPALAVALRAADASRAAILARWGGSFSVSIKANDPLNRVTEADREAEAAIRQVIGAAFPEHAITGEELGASGSGELGWLIDPIDGTLSFTHAIPFFSTLIALCQAGEPLVAVVDFPALDRRLHAMRGAGAWEGSHRLQVAPEFDPAGSLVCHGDRYTFEKAGRLELFDRLQGHVRLARSYTDAHGHCLVPLGTAALMVDPDLKPWDVAAPSLIVREAGGVVRSYPDPDDHVCVLSGSPAAITWAERELLQ